MLQWIRNYIQHKQHHHFRSHTMAMLHSAACAALGTRNAVVNCEHSGCTGWIILPRVSDQLLEGWRARG